MSGTGWYLSSQVDGEAEAASLQASIVHTVGLEPMVVTLQFSGAQLEELDPEIPLDLLDGVARDSLAYSTAGIDIEDETNPRTEPRKLARPPYRANLVVRAVRPDGATAETRVQDLFLDDVRIVGGRFAEAERRVYELIYQSVAKFWDDYGDVTRSWNVRLPNSARYDRTTLRAADSGERRPSTLREVVMDLCAELPGKPRLRRWPDGVEPSQPPEIRCWAARPKAVLKAILDHFRLVPVLERDRTMSVYRIGEGRVGERSQPDGGGNNNRGYDPSERSGVWEGLVPRATDFYSRRVDVSNPGQVVVVGARTVFTARVDYLTPVLLLDGQDENTGEQKRVVLDLSRETLVNALSLPEDVSDQVLQSIPLNREVWKTDLQGVPLEARQVLDRQMFRFYRVPRLFRRLLPILDRAERFPAGGRMPPVCEAFGFEAIQVEIPEAEFTAEELELTALEQRIGALEHQIDQLSFIDLDDLIRAAEAAGGEFALIVNLPGLFGAGDTDDLIQAAEVVAPGLSNEIRKTAQFLSNNNASAAEAAQSMGDLVRNQVVIIKIGLNGVERGRFAPGRVVDSVDGRLVKTLAGSAQAPILQVGLLNFDPATFLGEASTFAKIARSFDRLALRVAGEMVGVDDKQALDPDRQLKEQLERKLEAAKRDRLKLLSVTNPEQAIRERIAAKQKEIEEAEARTGVMATGRRAELEQIRREVEEAAAKRAARQAKAPRTAVVHRNLPRRPVDFRVVDADEGIIEVTGGLPVWLANPMAAKAGETYAVPMPVRLTFGTWNRAAPVDLKDVTPPEEENEYVRRTVEAIRAEAAAGAGGAIGAGGAGGAEFADWLAWDSGHLVPAEEGIHQARWGFDEEDPDEGLADLDPAESLVIQDPTLRLLVPLPLGESESNALELLDRARDAAQSALYLAQAGREAGSIDVWGPRPTNPNGRISAVRVHHDGQVTMTTVSFDTPTLPLFEVRRPPRERGYVSFTFGISEEQDR